MNELRFVCYVGFLLLHRLSPTTSQQFGNMELDDGENPFGYDTPSTPVRPVVTFSDDESSLLPCEYCQETFPSDELHQHMVCNTVMLVLSSQLRKRHPAH